MLEWISEQQSCGYGLDYSESGKRPAVGCHEFSNERPGSIKG